jgi:hypothetical protein
MPGADPSKYQYLPSGTPFPADHAIRVQQAQCSKSRKGRVCSIPQQNENFGESEGRSFPCHAPPCPSFGPGLSDARGLSLGTQNFWLLRASPLTNRGGQKAALGRQVPATGRGTGGVALA